MIKIENVVLPSSEQWKAIIMGCRNPKNSWNRSDSEFNREVKNYFDEDDVPCTDIREYVIGPDDLKLMVKLCNAGTDHGKFMRMIPVYVDIIAPLYFWKEFDSYKVGTVANSCSTMHKIADKEFTLGDFSCEHLFGRYGDGLIYPDSPLGQLRKTVGTLNDYRDIYLKGGSIHGSDICYNPKDKDIWWQMIQLLPSSYNQRRTVQLNYAVLRNMYHARKNHKLDEWKDFCTWMETLPCSRLITWDLT